MAVVLLLSFVLLLMLFRSVVVPLTAMAVNLERVLPGSGAHEPLREVSGV